MMDLKDAQDILYRYCSRTRTPSRKIPVREALNRVAAEDIFSQIDIPPFNKSAMDGYAVLEKDDCEEYRMLGTVRAGTAPANELIPGTCIKVMTGAPVPDGAFQVIPVENVEASDGVVRIVKATGARNICQKGEDIERNEKIASAGDYIDSILMSVLISSGIEYVDVHEKCRVAILSTGDELVSSMSEWTPEKIFDSNGPLLFDLARKYGAEIVYQDRLPDDKQVTFQNMSRAIQTADVILISGGVSAGDFDFIPGVMEAYGLKIHFNRLKVKPGKPMTFATDDNTLVLGFPGNPVSTYLMFHIFGVPAISGAMGSVLRPRFFPRVLGKPFSRKKAIRKEFIPVRTGEDGRIIPVGYHGSAHFAALRDVDGFAIIEPGVKSVDTGTEVLFWPVTMKGFGKDSP